MIPKKILIETIESFFKKIEQLDKDFEKETEDTWTLEKYQEWREMVNAWGKLENVIEFEIKPLTE